ncbi:NAD-binding protein [Neorhizobium sp. T786]|uniref:NAD-binding protein n=1 Tax=Pseudorhizobium xiangyangii TaxID=2883104 RepID=UPI001CFFDFD2|nr:NAD-binding protein [Neorhizobium xiangyangii]MCB5205138.1 NAD-binding protein [Neorhizobium xiangyangii]
MNIVVVGSGYVGLVSGACFSKLGHSVICVDSNEEQLPQIRQFLSIFATSWTFRRLKVPALNYIASGHRVASKGRRSRQTGIK